MISEWKKIQLVNWNFPKDATTWSPGDVYAFLANPELHFPGKQNTRFHLLRLCVWGRGQDRISENIYWNAFGLRTKILSQPFPAISRQIWSFFVKDNLVQQFFIFHTSIAILFGIYVLIVASQIFILNFHIQKNMLSILKSFLKKNL